MKKKSINREVIDALRKARKLLSDENKWYKGYWAADEYGFDISPGDPAACQWCMVGAIMKFTGILTFTYILGNTFMANIFDNVASYNDSPRTKHEDILTLLDWTIGVEEAGGF